MKIKIKIKSSDCSDRAREIRLCSRARRRVCGASPSSASVLSGLQRRSRPVCVLCGFTAVGGSPDDVLVTSLTQINCGFCHQTQQLWLVNLTGTKVTHKDGAKHNPPGLKKIVCSKLRVSQLHRLSNFGVFKQLYVCIDQFVSLAGTLPRLTG